MVALKCHSWQNERACLATAANSELAHSLTALSGEASMRSPSHRMPWGSLGPPLPIRLCHSWGCSEKTCAWRSTLSMVLSHACCSSQEKLPTFFWALSCPHHVDINISSKQHMLVSRGTS